MSLNKILLIGNVGTDPEMRYTPSGTAVTDFRLAVSRRYSTRDGGQQEETEWFTVVAWERLADQVNQYLQKGQKVYVEGRLRSRSWQGNDGQTRFVNEVVAFTVLFLDRPGTGDGEWGDRGQQQPQGRAQGRPQQQQRGTSEDYGAPPDDAEELPW